MAPNTGQPAFLIFKWVSFLPSVTGFYKTCVHLGPEYICSTKILHERAILKCSTSGSLTGNHIFYFKLFREISKPTPSLHRLYAHA